MQTPLDIRVSDQGAVSWVAATITLYKLLRRDTGNLVVLLEIVGGRRCGICPPASLVVGRITASS